MPGEGWSLWPGYIERGYSSCSDDITDPAARTGDMCWGNDNATMSLDGHSSQLVYAGGDIWRPQNDDGSRVQHVFGGVANGDNDNEWWKVTTTDGTQYFFGRATTSAWTVPVFGDDNGEPCHGGTFGTSSCPQAYRWHTEQGGAAIVGFFCDAQLRTATQWVARNPDQSTIHS